MDLEASLETAGIVIVLLVVILGYVVSTYQEFKILKQINNRLARLENAKDENRKSNQTKS